MACVVSWVGSLCRVVCGGLERRLGTGLRYLLTITLALAVWVTCVVSWVGSFCRVVCGGLESQSGTGLRYLLTITLAPTGLVNVCPVQVLFSSRGTGIAPLPLSNFSWGPGNLSLSYVLCTWPAIPRNLSLLYLLVVASSSSPLFSVTVGPMSFLSMLSPLLRSVNGRMASGQLAKSSFVKIDVDSQDCIRLLLIPYH